MPNLTHELLLISFFGGVNCSNIDHVLIVLLSTGQERNTADYNHVSTSGGP